MSDSQSLSVPLSEKMHLDVARVAIRLRKHKTQIVRACIALALRKLEDPATLIDLLETMDGGNQNEMLCGQESGLEKN